MMCRVDSEKLYRLSKLKYCILSKYFLGNIKMTYIYVNIVRNEFVHEKVARCRATLYVRVKFLSCNPLCGRVPHLRYKVT